MFWCLQATNNKKTRHFHIKIASFLCVRIFRRKNFLRRSNMYTVKLQLGPAGPNKFETFFCGCYSRAGAIVKCFKKDSIEILIMAYWQSQIKGSVWIMYQYVDAINYIILFLCGYYSRAGLIKIFFQMVRVVFESGSYSRAGPNCDFTVFKILIPQFVYEQ